MINLDFSRNEVFADFEKKEEIFHQLLSVHDERDQVISQLIDKFHQVKLYIEVLTQEKDNRIAELESVLESTQEELERLQKFITSKEKQDLDQKTRWREKVKVLEESSITQARELRFWQEQCALWQSQALKYPTHSHILRSQSSQGEITQLINADR